VDELAESFSPSERVRHAERLVADLTACKVLDFLSATLVCQRSYAACALNAQEFFVECS
jgi:hypothetical protein